MNIKFITLGCKVNQYETQSMREAFIRKGHTSDDGIKPDIVIINSCSVTAESDRKTRQILSRERRNNPSAAVVLTGCMVQAYPDDSKMLDADLVIGNKDLSDIVEKAVCAATNREKSFFYIPHKSGDPYNTSPISRFDGRTRAFMKIEDGCDRFCSYCIIPYARGRVRSRNLESIRVEAESLAKNGFSEIVLVGINLSAYGKGEETDICDAVEAVCAVNGIERVRLGSLEPDHINDSMLNRLKSQKKFCPQFHLSLQSGCDETLKRMNRHYDSAFYLDLITRIRNIFPDAAITTDIMVGFAGETEEEFNKSLEFAKKANFSRAHIFSYSKREGTVAAKYEDQVKSSEKARRSELMIKVTNESEEDFLDSYIGKKVSVLFEKNNEGYTPNYLRVVLKENSALIGEIADVIITERIDKHLLGNKL